MPGTYRSKRIYGEDVPVLSVNMKREGVTDWWRDDDDDDGDDGDDDDDDDDDEPTMMSNMMRT